ncbi:MAG: hypothetical protein AB7R00_25665 [Kofleriaceae bacterium]
MIEREPGEVGTAKATYDQVSTASAELRGRVNAERREPDPESMNRDAPSSVRKLREHVVGERV